MCAPNPDIFTLSVHAAANFPARKQQSSLDVALPDGLGDDAYIAAVAEVRPHMHAVCSAPPSRTGCGRIRMLDCGAALADQAVCYAYLPLVANYRCYQCW